MKSRIFLNLAICLFVGGTVISCNRVFDPAIPAVRTELSASISSAIKLVTTTSEGAADGYYVHGSQATLLTAITTAQVIYVDNTVSQETIYTAIDNLNAAAAFYKTQKVVPIDPANLIGQWTFDHIGTPSVGVVIKDYSGNGFDGVLRAGDPYWGSGVPSLRTDRYGVSDRSLHFDRGAHVEIPYNPTLNPSKISISLWAFEDVVDTILTDQFMISMNRKNCYELHFKHTPKTAVFTVNPNENPGGYISEDNGAPLSPGAWMHLVVTMGDGHMKFYVNGLLASDYIHPGTVISQSPGVSLEFGQDLPNDLYAKAPKGQDPNSIFDGGYFIGGMDEVRIYKSVLSPGQISGIYDTEKP